MSSSQRAGRSASPRSATTRRANPADREYRALFEHAPQAMLVYERTSLAILAVSAGIVRSYGYAREELMAMTITDLVPPEDRAALRGFVERDLGAERPGLVENKPWRVLRKDGSRLEIEVT